MVGVNFSRIKLLIGEKYWSPLKNWSLFTVFFFTNKVLFFSSKVSFTYDVSQEGERRGYVTFWFLLYFWSQPVFFLTTGEWGSNFLIFRLMSYVNDRKNCLGHESTTLNNSFILISDRIDRIKWKDRMSNITFVSVFMHSVWFLISVMLHATDCFIVPGKSV